MSTEKFETYPTRFKILNGDTVNYVDKYGFRQGKCTFYNDSLMTKGYLECVNDTVFKVVSFYDNKNIKSISTKAKPYLNYTSYIEYFESGKMKMECISKDLTSSFKEQGRCKEWNEKGEQTYDGVYRK